MTPVPNDKLKAVREGRGWKIAQIAQFLEVNPTAYGNWERGIRPSERNIERLCHLLRKTREELGFE